MSILKKHVVDAMCEPCGDEKPRFGKFLTNHFDVAQSVRMAVKPRNFTKAGFFFGIVPHVWGRLAYIRRAKAPVTRQDTNGEGGRRLEPVGSAEHCTKSGQMHLRRDGSDEDVKRGCDLHGKGFACSEIHQRGCKR